MTKAFLFDIITLALNENSSHADLENDTEKRERDHPEKRKRRGREFVERKRRRMSDSQNSERENTLRPAGARGALASPKRESWRRGKGLNIRV